MKIKYFDPENERDYEDSLQRIVQRGIKDGYQDTEEEIDNLSFVLSTMLETLISRDIISVPDLNSILRSATRSDFDIEVRQIDLW